MPNKIIGRSSWMTDNERKTMMMNKIVESFSWMTDVFNIQDIGPNTIRIKGVALRSDVVSKNNRKYVWEEVMKSGRTLINKPFTINHNDNLIIGHVDWAEPENGVLEYLATIKKQPYVDMFRNHDPRIQGVSVDADYLHAHCVHCSERFYDMESLEKHIIEKHGIKNVQVEPHQILFKALSGVISPEIPGVPGTTTELVEMYKNRGLLQLAEMLTKDKKEIMEKLSKAHINIRSQQHIAVGKGRKQLKIKEQEPPEEPCPEGHHRDPETGECVPDKPVEETHDCLEGHHWDDDQEKCVPDESIEEQEHQCPEGHHWDAEKETCVPDTPVTTEQEEEPVTPPQCPEGSHWDAELGICVPDESTMPTTEVKKPTMMELRLGEPFASYDSFADCVAENSDKEDPEAYCAEIKRQVEGSETFDQKYMLEEYKLQQRKTFDKLNSNVAVLRHAVREYAKDISTLKKALATVSQNHIQLGNDANMSLHKINEFNEQLSGALVKTQGVMETFMNASNTSLSNAVKQIRELQTRKPFDASPIHQSITELRKQLPDLTPIRNDVVKLTESVQGLELKLDESKTTYETLLHDIIEQVKTRDKQYDEFRESIESKLKDNNELNKLTESAKQDAQKMSERLDNVEADLKKLSEFKGQVQQPKSNVSSDSGNPYRGR